MKRFLIPIIFLLLPYVILGQSYPSGGTISGTGNIWSGTVTIGGDISVTGELTVQSGTTVVFTNTSAFITVSDTGSFYAQGALNDSILITADFNGNSIYGETGETWKHIVFDSGSIGEFSYCIFEYASSPYKNINGYGGALLSNSPNVSINNSTFRNNYGHWGGAVFVNNGGSIEIERTIFYNNSSNMFGGAIYFYLDAKGDIVNSVFYDNFTTNTTNSGGGAITQHGYSDVNIIGSTFSNNYQIRSVSGDAITVDPSYVTPPAPYTTNIINCVFWGSDNQIQYDYNAYTILNLTNCAYQGTIKNKNGVITASRVNLSNSFALNASNTDPNGPNFTDPSSNDWTITPYSPLFDAGTTPTPAVPTDFLGNNRIGAYDIGAYELQEWSAWKKNLTSTDWTSGSNWKGINPNSGTSNILIPNGASTYPITGNPSVTIATDKYLILESNAKATMASLRNSGILRLESDSTGTASLIMGSYNNNSGAGTEEIELYLSGGSDPNNKWHFISIPIANFDHSPISDTTLNLARYDENSLLDAGWVAYDGYVYYTQTMDGGAFSTLSIGKGYNYFYDRDVTYTLSGRLYTKTVNIGLSYSGSTPGSKVYGFNLLGNPFSSGLDWDAIVYVDGDVEAGVLNDNYPDNTSAAVFFTKDDEQVTYVAGVLSTSDEFDGVIPPMQGFFVKTYSTGNTISLPQAARTHGVKTSLFKGNSRSTIPLIRLGIGKGTEVLDQTVVRFNQKALFGIDNFYDAVKLLKQEGRNYISTTIDTTEFSINGVPFPAEDECMEIPISLTLAEEADYNISVSNLQNLDDYELSIVDLATNDTTKLTASTTLSFHAAAGELNERFVLLISPSSGDLPTYTPEIILPKAAADFTIYQSYNMINIEPATGNWDGITTRVSVINLAGQRVATYNAIEIQSGSISQIEAPATKGFYLVEIIGNNRRYVGKVVIR